MIYLMSAPTKNNVITSYFGERPGGYDGFHSGVDEAPIQRGVSGDPIFNVQEGIVKVAGWSGDSYGNMVVVEHTGYCFCSVYAHLESVLVSVGQHVNYGEVIALMGNTGMGTQSSKPVHLHFEVRDVLYKDWAGSRGTLGRTKCRDPKKYLMNINLPPGTINYAEYYQNQDYEYEKLILDQKQLQVYETMFGRKYRIMVFDENGEGIDVSEMHVIFALSKTITLDNSVSIVTIYNLNADTEGKLVEKAHRITIEAGYEGNCGLIFDGDIIQPIRYKENGTDYRLDLISMDGDRFLNQGFSAFTMTRGQTKRQVVEQIANTAKNPAKLGSISDSYNGTKYIRGKVVFGMAKDYLKQLATTEDSYFYMENGTVNLVSLSDYPEDEIIKLDSTSGLIGSPQQTEDGVTFKCLINPRIKINKTVNIDNSLIVERQYSDGSEQGRILDQDGTYRIISMNYSGDTRGQDWYIDCTAVSRSAGDLPQLLAMQLG